MRLALGLEYDGGPFSGWQTQPDGGGVQDHVERALAAIAGHPVATFCAGRTDAGVHASGQVIHFDTDAARPLQAWVRGTNSHLPPAAAVRWASEVAADFHARFAAVARRYRYRIYNHPTRSPLHAGRAAWVFPALDVAVMRAAAAALVGTHDFTSFRAAECQARTPIRTIYAVDITSHEACIDIHLRANAFLHHMVRNIAGALIWIGRGRREAEWMAGLLAARDRRLGPPTAAAEGLCLTAVEYDARFGIPPDPPCWPAP